MLRVIILSVLFVSSWFLLLSPSAFAAFNSPSPLPAPFSGRVLSVHDGDTLTVDRAGQAVVIRLASIDAPELRQPAGPESRAWLAARVLGRRVRVVPVSRDRYGRLVAEIRLGGRSINRAAVAAGWAWWYRQYAPAEQSLCDAESLARGRRRGLWALDEESAPPWCWRHR